MTPPVLRLALATVALATATLLAAGPASAASYTHEDPAKDVQRTTGAGALKPAPGNQSADLTYLQTEHKAKNVFLTSQVREVQTDLFQVEWRIRTSKGVEFSLYWAKLPGVGEFTLSKQGKTVACTGKRRSLDPMTDIVSFSVPRTCLGSPAWIRTGLWLMTQSADESTYYMDDAQRTGKQNRESIFLGPKVFHA